MPNFESQVLAEFGNLSSALRETTSGVHKRIDKLSETIADMDKALMTVTSATETNTEEIQGLKVELTKHKEGGAGLKADPPRRRPFAVTPDDLVGFIKILPLVAALAAGITGGILRFKETNDRPSPPAVVNPKRADAETDELDEEPKN